MDASIIRPLISGLVGAGITILLMRRWSKSLPQLYATKPIAQIAQENRVSTVMGNALFFAGLLGAIAMYKIGHYKSTDMTPFLLGFGSACVMPLIAIPAVAAVSGRRPSEAFVAFSVCQGTPMWATYGTLAIGTFLLVFGVIRIVT